MYNIMLASCIRYSDLTFVYIVNDHHNKPGYHLSPYKVNTILLTDLFVL